MVSTRRSRDTSNAGKDDGRSTEDTATCVDTEEFKNKLPKNQDDEERYSSRHPVKLRNLSNGGDHIVVGKSRKSKMRGKRMAPNNHRRSMETRHSLRLSNGLHPSMNETYLEFESERPMYGRNMYLDGGSPSRKQGKRKSEVRDLLAAQGKDLDEGDLYEEPDIYSSVKSRVRVSTKNKRYGDFLTGESSRKKEQEEGSQSEGTEEEEEDNEEDDEDEIDDDEDDEEAGHGYKLRKVREAPQRYNVCHIRKKRQRSLFEELPCSPARRRNKRNLSSSQQIPYMKRRRRARAQGSSSTSDDSSDDEVKFRKRQRKSINRARNECLPVNMTIAEIGKHSYSRERKRLNVASVADIDPMTVDTSVTFASVGGHSRHIQALKEMVVFPLRYPEFFKKFNVVPPRGCLFYGPPGTGKTLMARALANECSVDGQKVSFFMKKGADCLSKWVGESERQLRILFDQAYQMRPSIIFFDEIDGLAPVRSSRQDQIHSSIVSTLLALMDGLDNRGEIIVIGATNRIDSIDPALRRPGRFDREFQFPLPDKEARASILQIHTKTWDPPLKSSFVDYLAIKTLGYCGADLRALCTEASLVALRRRYPQIYETWDKLQLNVDSISIEYNDFKAAIKTIIPTSQRSIVSPARGLSTKVRPLLEDYLKTAAEQLTKLFPVLKRKSKVLGVDSNGGTTSLATDVDDVVSLYPSVSIYREKGGRQSSSNQLLPALPHQLNGVTCQSQYENILLSITKEEQVLVTVNRPRLIVCGEASSGFLTHLVPALLHDMEGVPIHCLDLPSIYGTNVRTPEESCAQVFREARRVTPSVIFLPNVTQWYAVTSGSVQATILSLLEDIPSDLPILFLASSHCPYLQLPHEFKRLFHSDFGEVYQPEFTTSEEQRRIFFAPIFLLHALTPPTAKTLENRCREVLKKAVAPEPAPLTEEEERRLEKEEESAMRTLRLFLRDVVMRLETDRRFKIFSKPVDPEEVPDYAQVIRNPMDFATMKMKIDHHKYHAVQMFLGDIDLICNNALEYNPDRRPEDKMIRHRACAMRDLAHAIIESDFEPQFEKQCQEIVESRNRRGVKLDKFAPKYQRVLPANLMIDPSTGDAIPKPVEFLEAQKPKLNETRQDVAESTPRKKRSKRSSWSRGIIKSHRKKRIDAAFELSSNNESSILENSESISRGDAHATITENHEEESTSDLEKEVIENGVAGDIEGEDSDFQKQTCDQNDCNSEKSSDESDSNSTEETIEDAACEDSKDIDMATCEEPTDIATATCEGPNDIAPEIRVLDESCLDNEIEATPPKKMTLRPRTAGRSEQVEAIPTAPPPPPPPPFVVDRAKFAELLERVVVVTESFSLCRLERVHTVFSRCIDRHKMEYDRTALSKDLENEIENLTTGGDDNMEESNIV